MERECLMVGFYGSTAERLFTSSACLTPSLTESRECSLHSAGRGGTERASPSDELLIEMEEIKL